MADNTNSTSEKQQFYRKKHKEEMKHHVLTFVMMIAFTLIAFGLVMADVSAMFTIPIILIMAAVQVAFQLYYFMHLNQEGHEMPALMIYSGIFAAFLTILALTTIVWW
ncbi:cytochrome c oxidase subunit IVB [Tenuibacillus multivorans]|uniref:Cytochrome c oxidase subunit 4 n=1 Tax=Tenuibacillus multivorans TaxID=237069 RepID=A0A1G9YBV2_9BACI|nr:cytochrome c oxidase subunit IVB [Tenuibacillus multivorans]GEL76009.1 cytochrome c oxidase subunit 4B [Tenuibacillus multivorans]SDN05893.1 cytochrome c oxidase subunit 4 [Tenuibacillus multivorans]